MENNYCDIRSPDKIKKDKLLDDDDISDVTDYDYQINAALYLSSQEIKYQIDLNSQFEEKLLGEYLIETSNRRDNFRDLLLKLNKLIKFDQSVKPVYTIIIQIIEKYCSQTIQYFEVNTATYEKIFDCLKTIRVDQKNLEILHSFILITDIY
jgi:hypothetical protein